jgi:DDE superfamily endonuclease
VVKEIVFPKNGDSSVGVARQFTHSTGRVLNCQRAIAIFLVGARGCCPVNWRLALPTAWDEDSRRREAARVPEDERCLPIWRHVLDALEEMAAVWCLPPAPVIADIRFEQDADALTAGLESLGLNFVVRVAGSSPAMVVQSGPSAPLTLSFSDVITHSLKRSPIAMSTWQISATRPGRSRGPACRCRERARPPRWAGPGGSSAAVRRDSSRPNGRRSAAARSRSG